VGIEERNKRMNADRCSPHGSAALHAHIFPRYRSEPVQYRKGPVWHYTPEQRASVRFDPGQHGSLQQALRSFIESHNTT
jgi:hypothetical protein